MPFNLNTDKQPPLDFQPYPTTTATPRCRIEWEGCRLYRDSGLPLRCPTLRTPETTEYAKRKEESYRKFPVFNTEYWCKERWSLDDKERRTTCRQRIEKLMDNHWRLGMAIVMPSNLMHRDGMRWFSDWAIMQDPRHRGAMKTCRRPKMGMP